MTVQCRKCAQEYVYERSGDFCPYCGSPNALFRSQGAKLTMGIPNVSNRQNPPSDARHISHKAFLESLDANDPFAGKTAFRRIRPYLLILVFLCGFVMLGSMLISVSNQMSASSLSSDPSSILPSVAKKPIAEYASASFGSVFHETDGVLLQSNYTGLLQDEDAPGLSACLPEGVVCLFVDVAARFTAAEGVQADSLPGTLFLRTADDTAYDPADLNALSVDVSAFTPFPHVPITRSGHSGQFFFFIPETETQKEFFLCWYHKPSNVEQRIPLHL